MNSPNGGTSTRRADLLEEVALSAARDWTTDWLTSLAEQKRPVAGGWPGTMSDARARAAGNAARMLRAHALPPLEHGELDGLARSTYKEAQRLWRARAPAPTDDV